MPQSSVMEDTLNAPKSRGTPSGADLHVPGGSPYIRCPAPSTCQDSLRLEWVFGLHKDFKSVIHNLSTTPASSKTGGRKKSISSDGSGRKRHNEREQRRVFYPIAHVGVLYDVVHNTQHHLMGHSHTIVASCCSHNHRFIVTIDEGDRACWPLRGTYRRSQMASPDQVLTQEEDINAAAELEACMIRDPVASRIDAEDDGSLMIVWDTTTGLPVRTIPVGKYGGVVSCAMSPDGLYIATINRRTPQEIMVWGWTVESSSKAAATAAAAAATAAAASSTAFGVTTPATAAAMDGVSSHISNNSSTADLAEAAGTLAGGTAAGGALGEAATIEELVPEFVRLIPSQDEQTSIRFSTDDPRLICTNGLRRVMFWSWMEGMLKYYSPPILQKDLKAPVGNFTQTIFVPGTDMACTGTVDGDVVLWAIQPKDRIIKQQDKTLLKMVRVHIGGVTYITSESGHIVTGGMDGSVRFLDTKLRLVAWFEDLNGGPIISISFDKPSTTVEENISEVASLTQRHLQRSGTLAASQYIAPDFMVSTANAMIIDVPTKAFHTTSNELPRGKLIVQGQDQAIECLAAHPRLPRLAIAGLSGSLHLWDYQQKRVLMLSMFRNLLVRCMAIDLSGAFLVVGFTNGVLKVLDAETLEEKQNFKPKRADSILRICFSEDSRMMATGTAGGLVGLYEYAHHNHDPTKPREWIFTGHHKTHRAPISGLQFGHNTNGEAVRLLSVGEDKRLIEYNLVETDAESGLLLRMAHKITQGPVPTGFLWTKERSVLDDASRPRSELDFVPENADSVDDFVDPGSVSHNNSARQKNRGGSPSSSQGQGRVKSQSQQPPVDYLIIATNEYKFGVYLSDWSRQCVKTVLAPTFGGPVTDMAIVPAVPRGSGEDNAAASSNAKCMVYSTKEKVIGLVELPLRGNPCASMGLLAHPGPILSTVVSHDGAFVFTAGGEDQSVMQWRVDGTKIMPPEEAQQQKHVVATESPSAVPLDHLLAIVEGGAEGDLIKEIVDYFYYAQIRTQGEETTAKRELLGAIRFSQLPNLFRALGYYPSELEIGHLTYEVANMYGPVGEALEEVDVDAVLLNFSQFMRLYINYRPVFGITQQDIERAFVTIGADAVTGHIGRDAFFQMLSTKGEPLRTAEISAALTSLLGEGVRVDMLEEEITARAFAENLLGFEDYDGGIKEDVDEEDEEDSDAYDDDDGLGF